MQTLGTLRYTRGVQALTDLFQYDGKGESAEAALDAIARIAHGKCAAIRGTADCEEPRASRHRGRGAGAPRRRAQLAPIQAALANERSDSLALTSALRPRCCRMGR